MSDDRKTPGARELEILRRQYNEHRDALTEMAAAAPTEMLATEYNRLIEEIESSLAKLDEIDSGEVHGFGAGPGAAQVQGDPKRAETTPGARPLVPAPSSNGDSYEQDVDPGDGGSRLPVILLLGVAVLGLIGWLVWRASSDHPAAPAAVTEATPAPATETAPATAEQAPVAAPPVVPAPHNPAVALAISPASADYGTIGRGARAVRQFELTNRSAAAISYSVARSQCRCLYYEYRGKLEPKQKETLTVTVDGAKVKSGGVQEIVAVTSKSDPAVNASFSVTAVVK